VRGLVWQDWTAKLDWDEIAEAVPISRGPQNLLKLGQWKVENANSNYPPFRDDRGTVRAPGAGMMAIGIREKAA
jgi:hypothetical protein